MILLIKRRGEIQGATQQINGREGKTATLLSRCMLKFGLRIVGFALYHRR